MNTNAPAIVAAAERLRVDVWTAEVIGAMRARGVRAILLKGPAVARWLYPDDPDQRSYTDADLIVSPTDTQLARELLGELGFVSSPYPESEDHALHARPYEREGDGAAVDLHQSLHGLQGVPREQAWQAVSRDTVPMCVGNAEVEVPGTPARILHLVMHLEPSDGPRSSPWRDLERGVQRCTQEDWRSAADLARELGVEQEFAVRLRRLTEGAELAEQLRLARRGSRYYRLLGALKRGDAPASVLSIWGLMSLPDARSRLAYVRGKVLPSERALREQSTIARRGHIRLARALRILDILARLPATVLAWVRYYRE